MRKSHTDREYESQLKELRERLLLMAGRVEEMITQSVQSLIGRDAELARRTIEADHRVNRDEVEIDELCLLILAKRQPMASDLRFITLALKMVTDLERIGDVAVNVCERSIELSSEPAGKSYDQLPEMADTAKAMVREALDAFIAGDAERASQVIKRDRVVDAYYAQIFRAFLTAMTEDPESIYRSTRIQSIAKYLERIGDHATNLAEMVVFMVKGKDIRHLGSLDEIERGYSAHGVLFLCVQNSARSQMAEGWARKLFPPGVRIWSAGSQPARDVNPAAIRVMKEVGIDISQQSPKRISDVPLGDVDTVITLCAEEVCVALPGELRREAWVYSDPAAVKDSDEEEDSAFRHVRDDLRHRMDHLVKQS